MLLLPLLLLPLLWLLLPRPVQPAPLQQLPFAAAAAHGKFVCLWRATAFDFGLPRTGLDWLLICTWNLKSLPSLSLCLSFSPCLASRHATENSYIGQHQQQQQAPVILPWLFGPMAPQATIIISFWFTLVAARHWLQRRVLRIDTKQAHTNTHKYTHIYTHIDTPIHCALWVREFSWDSSLV